MSITRVITETFALADISMSQCGSIPCKSLPIPVIHVVKTTRGNSFFFSLILVQETDTF